MNKNKGYSLENKLMYSQLVLFWFELLGSSYYPKLVQASPSSWFKLLFSSQISLFSSVNLLIGMGSSRSGSCKEQKHGVHFILKFHSFCFQKLTELLIEWTC